MLVHLRDPDLDFWGQIGVDQNSVEIYKFNESKNLDSHASFYLFFFSNVNLVYLRDPKFTIKHKMEIGSKI